MIVKIMVKKNRFSLGNDEYELIKCLIHYSLGKYDFDQIARKREMIESRNVCSENGYLFAKRIGQITYGDIIDENLGTIIKNDKSIKVFSYYPANVSKTARSLIMKKLIKQEKVQYKDRKGRLCEQVVYKICSNEVAFHILIYNFHLKGEMNFLVSSDFYNSNRNIPNKWFGEIAELLQIQFKQEDFPKFPKGFEDVVAKFNKNQVQTIEKWLTKTPMLLIDYITDPTRFKARIYLISSIYRTNGIPPLISAPLFFNSFVITSFFDTTKRINSKNNGELSRLDSDYKLLTEQCQLLRQMLDIYSDTRNYIQQRGGLSKK